MPNSNMPNLDTPNLEAILLRQLAAAEIAPDDQGEPPLEFYEALEALAVFYVRVERLDAARPYWERLWDDFPASCWTHESFERFAFCWLYHEGEDPDNADVFSNADVFRNYNPE